MAARAARVDVGAGFEAVNVDVDVEPVAFALLEVVEGAGVFDGVALLLGEDVDIVGNSALC
ncbi:hypothetical protein [Demetria terragena]|uniref:hypothetical protein n=1 Tax=Demetria terragena TaxID=63959 RepID=UPI0014615B08|nr:hypothetical protein [Demetria terragena]